jgi:hypothetical protein
MPAEIILFGGPYDGVVMDAQQYETITIDRGRGSERYKRTRIPDSEGREILAHRPVFDVMYARTGGQGPHGPTS